jgi:hypothetical protein
MSRVPVELRAGSRVLPRSSRGLELSRQTQKEHREQDNISPKNFGNWRAQLTLALGLKPGVNPRKIRGPAMMLAEIILRGAR